MQTQNKSTLTSHPVGDVTYSDLCYKPLGEFNKTHPKEDCATLSVFQWLDNDRNLLENPAEYIKRFVTDLCSIISFFSSFFNICEFNSVNLLSSLFYHIRNI